MTSSKFSFLIPLSIESDDRLRNVSLCIRYLRKHLPDCSIIVKECDSEMRLPEYLRDEVYYSFEKNDSNVFHKTRYFNEMLNEVTT